MLCRAAVWSNRETKRICAVGKLAVRTGGEKEIGERNGKTPLRKRKLLLCPTNEEWYAGKALR